MTSTPFIKQTLAAGLLLSASLALPVFAASSTASSASEGASSAASSGSKSLEQSSASSKGNKVAAGDYKIIDVAAAADRPGMLRVHLQAAAEDFYLVLPELAFEKSQLTAGQMVTARQHAYGLEFANQQTQRSFFLVLSDEWAGELDSRAVVL